VDIATAATIPPTPRPREEPPPAPAPEPPPPAPEPPPPPADLPPGPASVRNALFGKLAVATKFITEEQLAECLREQREAASRGEQLRLGEIFERRKLLTGAQIEALLSAVGRPEKRLFGEIAQAFHFATAAQVESALSLQKLLQVPPAPEAVELKGESLVTYRRYWAQKRSHDKRPKIGEILRDLGAMRTHQVDAVLTDQGKRMVACGSCGAGLDVAPFKPGQRIRCAGCHAVLEVIEKDGRWELTPPPQTHVFKPPTGDLEQIDPATALLEVEKEFAARRSPALKSLVEDVSNAPPLNIDDSRAPMPRRIGEFRILGRLGADATGQLFKAQQISRDRLVVLKVMRRAVMEEKEYRDRFLAEVQAAAAIEHPALRRLYSAVRTGDHWLVAMEYFEGDSLFSRLNKEARFSVSKALKLVRPVLDALEAAHAAGLVHGDVRPSNVLVTKDGQVKLANLGLAPRISDNIFALTKTGDVAPLSFAPEWVTGDRKIDGRADIYAVGALLFHLISGRPPYEGRSPFEVLVKVAEEKIPALGSRAPSVPPRLDEAVARMLQPEPEQRYATIADVRKALAEVQVAEEVQAAAAPPEAKAAPPPPPSKAMLYGGVAAAVLLVILIGTSLSSAFRASERRDQLRALTTRVASGNPTRAESHAAAANLRDFAHRFEGTPEAREAEAQIGNLETRLAKNAAVEIVELRQKADGLATEGRFGLARAVLAEPQFADPSERELRTAAADLIPRAEADWKAVSAAALDLARQGKAEEARAAVKAAKDRRSLAAEDMEAGRALEAAIGVEATAAEARRKEEEARKAEEAERIRREAVAEADRQTVAALWTAVETDVSRWDLAAAASAVTTARKAVSSDTSPRVAVIGAALDALRELRAAALVEVGGAPGAWKVRFGGVEYAVLAADEQGVTLKAESERTETWGSLPSQALVEIMSRAAGNSPKPGQEAALTVLCLARAATSTEGPGITRWLLEEAERRSARAGEASLTADVAARIQQAIEASRDALVRLVAAGDFEVALEKSREFRNSWGRRALRAELASSVAALEKNAALGATPDALWFDFDAPSKAMELGEGWALGSGVLSGKTQESSIRVKTATFTEVAFFARFQKAELKLLVHAGNAELRMEPFRPRLALTVRPKDGPPESISSAEGADALRAREWHLVQLRWANGEVRARLDGRDAGTLAAEPPAGEVRIELSGPSQNQEGSIEIDSLVVKGK
jgi:serine/threonine-protein kinase